MTAFTALGDMTKEAYRGRAMAAGGMDVLEQLLNLFRKAPKGTTLSGGGGMDRGFLKKIPASNATKEMSAPWRTAGQYAGIGGITGGIGAGIGAGVDAIRGKGMFTEDGDDKRLGRNGVHPDLQKIWDRQATKEAARGDQFLRAATKALTAGATKMTPATRYRALTRVTPQGYDGGASNVLHRILSGTAGGSDEAGTVLKLLTGRGTKNTNTALLTDSVRSAARGEGVRGSSDLNSSVTQLRELLPALVARATSARAVTRLPNLSNAGILGSLKV